MPNSIITIFLFSGNLQSIRKNTTLHTCMKFTTNTANIGQENVTATCGDVWARNWNSLGKKLENRPELNYNVRLNGLIVALELTVCIATVLI